MGMQCPWCKSDMPFNASVCPHCTRSAADYWQQVHESRTPKMPPAHTLPCHGCGAFVPMDLFGDSRAGDRPGRCPACSCSLDTSIWDARFDAGLKGWRPCSCGNGRCVPCGGTGRRTVEFWIFSFPAQCAVCEGSGRCRVCLNGKYNPKEVMHMIQTGYLKRPPEPKYTTFVPPPDWTYWCPVCGARLQTGTNVVCWNCNYGT